MGLRCGIVPLKKLQDPQVALGIYIPGFQAGQGLEFGNSQVGAPLIQVLLGQPGMLGDLGGLVLARFLAVGGRLGEERNGEKCQDYGTKFFFTRIACE
jgi:hypothetical protein